VVSDVRELLSHSSNVLRVNRSQVRVDPEKGVASGQTADCRLWCIPEPPHVRPCPHHPFNIPLN